MATAKSSSNPSEPAPARRRTAAKSAEPAPASSSTTDKPAAPRRRRTPTAQERVAAPASEAASGAAPPVSDSATVISSLERRALIARAAYLRAAARGFAPGHELEDWYAAEAEVDAQLGGKR